MRIVRKNEQKKLTINSKFYGQFLSFIFFLSIHTRNCCVRIIGNQNDLLLLPYLLIYIISGETGTWKPIFGYPESSEKWVEGISWTRLFYFAIFDDFSKKFRSTFVALHFEKSSNMVKIGHKMKKILVQLAFIPILRDTAALKPGFRAPSPPLITRIFGDRNKSSDGPPYRKIQKEP